MGRHEQEITRMKRLLSMLAVLLIAGCQETAVDGPPELKLGRDECVHCGMIINDARYAAAALIEVDGRVEAVVFDDIGDLVEYAADNPAVVIRKRYVSDYATKLWLVAEEAVIVHVSELHTPMGSGLIAFSSPDSAAGQNGRQLAFKDLKSRSNDTETGSH
jgi:copper chaperone NosL